MTVQVMQRVKEQNAEPGLAPRRVVFVTGGMGGIGTAICRRLASMGHTIVAGCLPEYDRKEEWLDDMRKEGFKAHAAEGDVSEFESCAEMFYNVRASTARSTSSSTTPASRAT
jgi:NAD(P)-dependent dehydrogenase (short-subunit alcohol dehydrogenase family)